MRVGIPRSDGSARAAAASDSRTPGPKPPLTTLPPLAHREGGRRDGRQVEARVTRVVQRKGVRLPEGRAQQPAGLLFVLRRGPDGGGGLSAGGDREHALVARA